LEYDRPAVGESERIHCKASTSLVVAADLNRKARRLAGGVSSLQHFFASPEIDAACKTSSILLAGIPHVLE
jgi:hypothetical protein